MESTADLLLFLAIAAIVISWSAIVGKMEEKERQLTRNRQEVNRQMTRYQQRQARLALNSGTIKKGER